MAVRERQGQLSLIGQREESGPLLRRDPREAVTPVLLKIETFQH